MAWRNSGSSNDELVSNLKRNDIIQSDKVYNVMKSVDRGKYINKSPYEDCPQSIGYGATISAPHIHAYALEYLVNHLGEGMKALDVGSGSGYMTACFGLMVGETGKVIGIDHVEELVEMGRSNIQSDNPELLSSNCVSLVVGDGRKGYSHEGPFNAIHVGAAAETIPQALIDQLAPGGKLIIAVGRALGDQNWEIVDKDMNGSVSNEVTKSVRFVALTDKSRQLGFRGKF